MLNRRFRGRAVVPAAVLPAVRPLRGRHRRSCSGCSSSPDALVDCVARTRRPRAPRPGLAGRHHDRDVHAVRDHLVEVLRLPHDPDAGRPPGHPARDQRGGPDRRRRPRQAFRYITLPLLGPTIRVSVFLSIIGALQLFDMVWVMTGGGPLNASSTMAIEMFKAGFTSHADGLRRRPGGDPVPVCLVVALLYQRFVLRRDTEGAITSYGG